MDPEAFLFLIDFDFAKKGSKENAYHGGKLDCLLLNPKLKRQDIRAGSLLMIYGSSRATCCVCKNILNDN